MSKLPVYIWFGIASMVFLLVTAFMGWRRKIKLHKIFAYLTLTAAFLHVLGVLGLY